MILEIIDFFTFVNLPPQPYWKHCLWKYIIGEVGLIILYAIQKRPSFKNLKIYIYFADLDSRRCKVPVFAPTAIFLQSGEALLSPKNPS